MCLIVFAYKHHPDYPLIVAANRDEFYERPTEPAAFWPEAPRLLAGRDRKLGGTWFGVTRGGRFAALSNYRDPQREADERRSRGELVRDCLFDERSPGGFLEDLARDDAGMPGFNLLAGTVERLWYHSNCGVAPRRLEPGVYGLSNHLLDTPWPKVVRARTAFAAHLERKDVSEEALFCLLADTELAPDAELPDTGIGLEFERVLSAPFIVSPEYGTRASTVLLCRADGLVRFSERTFFRAEGPRCWHQRTFRFQRRS